jgi:hypothetical protein
MTGTQTFVDRDATGWTTIHFLPGVTLLPLAQPVKDGSIHRARLSIRNWKDSLADRRTEFLFRAAGIC